MHEARVDMVTLGQYLRPGQRSLPVSAYVHPDVFARHREYAMSLGFKSAVSAPFVRSSYHAHEYYFQGRKM
jgi:lipoic acid synthetase